MLSNVIDFILNSVDSWGYWGIFVMMFLESTFFPFPSEVAMIPAGYLAFLGKMNLVVAILFGVSGSVMGAIFNYYLAFYLGRGFLVRYGKYLLISEQSLMKLDNFFVKHGHISTFIGRLIPGIRQLISLPAGLSRMNIFEFVIYTILGATIWATILALIGYFVGANEYIWRKYLKEITIVMMFVLTIIVLIYIKKVKKKNIS